MLSKRPARSLGWMVIALMALTGLSFEAYSQDSRPRYSARQHAGRHWTIPENTIVSMRMDSYLSSRTARVGDRFTATVTIPVYVNGKTVVPAGSRVEGRVTEVTPAKRMSKSGTIAIDFDELIFPNGSRVRLIGSLTSDDPEMQRKIDEESRVSGTTDNRSAVFVGGGGAVWAVLGGMAGGGKGAVLGGIAGAGAGVAGVLLSKGEEAQVPTGTTFGIQLRQPLVIEEGFVSEDGSGPSQVPDRYDPPRTVDRDADRDYDRRNAPRSSEPSNPGPPPETRRTEPRPVDPEPVDAEPEPAESSAPPLPLSSPEMVKRAQVALKEQGYYEGPLDGTMGPRTSNAIRTYQSEHNLPETGDLDPGTARSLKILGAGGSSPSIGSGSPRPVDPRPAGTRPAEPRSTPPRSTSRSAEPVVTEANVLSATATRNADGSISVTVNTQANTGGWRWFGEHVVNGDTLEVYARAERPTGMVTQALTRGRIDMTVRDGVDYVRRVVVHGSGADVAIPLRSVSNSGGNSGGGNSSVGNSANSSAGLSLQRQAEELLSEYQRATGIRQTGAGVEMSGRSNSADIELLFAIDGFANAAQLYARLLPSLRDQEGLRSAALSLAKQARRTDITFTSTSSRVASSLGARWDAIRQDVLRLMDNYNISADELDN
jgi:peptidoglycan hydrolase-like protein with peptidoglycan-binding domain